MEEYLPLFNSHQIFSVSKKKTHYKTVISLLEPCVWGVKTKTELILVNSGVRSGLRFRFTTRVIGVSPKGITVLCSKVFSFCRSLRYMCLCVCVFREVVSEKPSVSWFLPLASFTSKKQNFVLNLETLVFWPKILPGLVDYCHDCFARGTVVLGTLQVFRVVSFKGR